MTSGVVMLESVTVRGNRLCLIALAVSVVLIGTVSSSYQGNDGPGVSWRQQQIHASRKGRGGGTKWATKEQEALDEKNDIELYRAVLTSVLDWQARQRAAVAANGGGSYGTANASAAATESSAKSQEPKSAKDEVHLSRRRRDESQSDGVTDASPPTGQTQSGGVQDQTPSVVHGLPLPPPNQAVSSICYPEVGCFTDSGYLDMLPSPPDVVSTRFLVYSARGGRSADTPHLDVSFSNMSSIDLWAAKALNMSLPTKVIVHGFGSSCSHVWVYEMRSALMSVENCNVVCVDWEPGASFPNYVRAAANTRLVGRQLSMLLTNLRDKHGLDLNTVHIIGFSLGAHAAAFAGSHLRRIRRITGLDPAGPLFESQDGSLRLDSNDAQYVDVIHSNGEALILGGLGSWQPMGHVDFYPNGGRMQKGCSNLFVGAFTDILWSGAALEGRSLCNHRRAYKFFTDSVSPRCKFPAVPCKSYEAYLAGECFPCPQGASCPSMGYYADATGAQGTLYLVTRDEEPFCAHQYLVQVRSSQSALPVVSYGKIQLTLITDGQINETFTLTSKDDEELAVGTTLSKIVVPHPAVEEFNKAALLYTAYTGWISSGLAKWSIDSIVLTDSLGNKKSVCTKDLVLESGVAEVLPLTDGDCNRSEAQSNITNIDIQSPSMTSPPYQGPSTTGSATVQSFNYVSTHQKNASEDRNWLTERIVRLTLDAGDTGSANDTGGNGGGGGGVVVVSSYQHRSGLEWDPVLEVPDRSGATGNSVESDLNSTEIVEPVLRPTKLPRVLVPRSRGNGHRRSPTTDDRPPPLLPRLPIEERWFPNPDLTPPAMGATESWKHWELVNADSTTELEENSTGEQSIGGGKQQRGGKSIPSEDNRSFTSLPQRLAQMLERYARMALAPFRSADNERSLLRRFSWFLPAALVSWGGGGGDEDDRVNSEESTGEMLRPSPRHLPNLVPMSDPSTGDSTERFPAMTTMQSEDSYPTTERMNSTKDSSSSRDSIS